MTDDSITGNFNDESASPAQPYGDALIKRMDELVESYFKSGNQEHMAYTFASAPVEKLNKAQMELLQLTSRVPDLIRTLTQEFDITDTAAIIRFRTAYVGLGKSLDTLEKMKTIREEQVFELEARLVACATIFRSYSDKPPESQLILEDLMRNYKTADTVLSVTRQTETAFSDLLELTRAQHAATTEFMKQHNLLPKSAAPKNGVKR